MSDTDVRFDEDQALSRLLRFLSVEGTTGNEKAIAAEVVSALVEVGVPRRSIHYDDANLRIPLPTQTGNVIATLPGTRSDLPRLLFMTHLDTVPLCAGARPVHSGKRIKPAGKTALGGDNRTGVACLVTLAATLRERRLPHPPLTFLFTVREESGLWGARHVDLPALGDPVYGFNVDGSVPSEITVGAVGAERWEVEVFGTAAHAGGHPERGVSATVVTALALAEVYRDGWFGKVMRDGHEGTSNVGSVGDGKGRSAGEATNVVTDYALVRGESRSSNVRFATTITAAYKRAFQKAAKQVSNDRGLHARVQFRSRRDYYPFRIKEDAPVVRHALAAAESAGMKPIVRTTKGGLDANWMVRHGIPTITFGAGQRDVHTVLENVELSDFFGGCRMALALAQHAVPSS
jgi:tripeptide aminopeptidase